MFVCNSQQVHFNTYTEFTSLVMEDSKRRKKEWKIKLADMELTNCLQVRDTLMAMASIHLMETDDCKSTIAVINNQVINSFSLFPPSCYFIMSFSVWSMHSLCVYIGKSSFY